jgi:hypothetical protein
VKIFVFELLGIVYIKKLVSADYLPFEVREQRVLNDL